MIPIPVVTLLLGAMATFHKIQMVQAVSTAAATSFTSGAATGGLVGAAVGSGIARPHMIGSVITLPLRVINAPFYYLLGGHASDQRMRVLELASSNMGEAQSNWLKSLQDKALRFDGIEVRLTESYIKKLKEHFANLATTSTGEGRISMLNPSPPSFCSMGEFVDPFGERYTCIVLNDHGHFLATSVLVIITIVCGVILLMYVIRLFIRHTLRGVRVFQRMVSEESLTYEKQSLEHEFLKPSIIKEIK